jgi:hypothetical protein
MTDSAPITNGQSLNSYQGNAALAAGDGNGGEAVGYDKVDLSPLQTYALNKYKTNLIDYEQQQKDKKELEAKFMDPSQNVFLDETYADQVKPIIDRQKELALKNLQMNPNSKEWYEFHNNYEKLAQANAQLKTVQTLKQKAQDAAGASADPHEKERLLSYADQLGKYKLGEEIPSYNKYFAYNDAHIPTGDEVSGTKQRIVGDKVQTVKYSINDPSGLDEKANQQSVTTPESAQTGQDIAHTLITHGGVPELNQASQETYNAAQTYKYGLLRDKYKTELAQYQKDHPGNGFQQFMIDTGKQDEIKAIDKKLEYLKTPVEYVSTDKDPYKFLGFTYSDDGKKRLNVSDNTLRAIYGANKTKPGAKEEVIKEELSKTPAEIAKLNAETAKAKSDAAVARQKANDNSRLTSAKITHIKAQTAAIDPIPESVLPQIGGAAELTSYTDFSKTGNPKSDKFIVRAKDLPEDLRQVGGFGTIPQKPKITGNPEKDKAAMAAYNDDMAQTEKGVAELRFFNSKGEDETDKFIKVVKAKKGTLTQAMSEAPSRGYSVKFIDATGNVIGTTQSIDKQTLKESNKNTKKGQAPLGTDLPTDNSDEE